MSEWSRKGLVGENTTGPEKARTIRPPRRLARATGPRSTRSRSAWAYSADYIKPRGMRPRTWEGPCLHPKWKGPHDHVGMRSTQARRCHWYAALRSVYGKSFMEKACQSRTSWCAMAPAKTTDTIISGERPRLAAMPGSTTTWVAAMQKGAKPVPRAAPRRQSPASYEVIGLAGPAAPIRIWARSFLDFRACRARAAGNCGKPKHGNRCRCADDIGPRPKGPSGGPARLNPRIPS